MTDTYWDFVWPTYIENWPRALCSLSIPQIGMKLTQDQTLRLGKNIMEYGECFYPNGREQQEAEGTPPIADIEDKLETIVRRFPKDAHPSTRVGHGRDPQGSMFVRLGSRSPKDAHTVDPVVICGAAALRRLCDGSERVYEDLMLALQQGYDPYIWLRQWMEIPVWSEFRCFQRDRKLIGISEYDYLGNPHPELQGGEAESIKWAIERFWTDYFKPACHLDNVVFDVFVDFRVYASTRDIRSDTGQPTWQAKEWQVKLLEINPFFEFTDPCLFDWRNGGDFNVDRTGDFFRYRKGLPSSLKPTDKEAKYERKLDG